MHDMPLADSLTVMSPADKAYFGSSPKFGGQPLQINKGINDPNLGYQRWSAEPRRILR